MRPVIFFPRVVAADAAAVGGLHGLAVQDRRTRLGVATLQRTQRLPQDVVDVLPRSVEPPAAEVAVHRFPRGEVVRQHAPRTATAQDIQDAVDEFAVVILAGPPAWPGLREQMFDVVPLQVREIAGIRLPCHARRLTNRRKGAKTAF